MIRTTALAVTVASLCAGALTAQGNAQCNSYGAGIFGSPSARNVCNAAVDGASVFAPVAGVLITAGNPFLGATGGAGGFPHIGLTLRVNSTQIVVPDVTYDGSTTTVAAKQALLAPAPLVEGALGIYRGTRSGALALDVLGSAQLLPTKLIDDVRIDVNASSLGSIALGLGVGGRLTLIGEHGALPAVTVSYMHRSLPRIGVGDVHNGDRYSFASDLGAGEYRATVGKRFGPLDLGAGAGWTTYHANAEIVFVNPLTNVEEPPIALNIDDSRAMGFVDGGLALGRIFLIGEAGLQRGKDLNLVTTFSGNDPRDNRFFASVGFRFGI